MLLWVVLSCLLGLGIGAGGMYYLSTSIYDYGIVSSHISDATVDVAVLERLAQQDTEGAAAALKVRLRGSMLVLSTDKERLTQNQRQQISSLDERARPFLQ